MPAEDEHDPLDRWLHQQVRPLPPPPGTFELIKTRARRRKLRKLAVTVVSAAAVVAGVAVAVPNVTALHLSPSSTSGSSVADGGKQSATSGATESTNGSGNRYTPPPPSSAASTPAPTAVATDHPVPANFQPSSVTFVSPTTGWVIGQAGTAGQCANKNPYVCTSIASTDNAGQSWQGGPAPSTTGPNGPTGVSGVRFLNSTTGWAFGPELWVTNDGGSTWSKVDTNGQRVTDLETVDGRAYALFATCSGTSTSGFALNCTSFTLMTATAGGGDWAQVGGSTTDLGHGGDATSAVLGLTGSDGYLLAPDGTLYSGPIGDSWSAVGPAPCRPGTPQASGLPGSALLALVSSTELALACAGTTATAAPVIYTSSDSGTSWTRSAAGWDLSDFGTPTSLTAAPDGALVLATTAGLYVLPVGAARWQATSATGSKAPAGGFSYVGMTTDAQGVAVPTDMELHQVLMTFDGGVTWTPTSITPGN